MKKKSTIIILSSLVIVGIIILIFIFFKKKVYRTMSMYVNLTELTYEDNDLKNSLKVYTQNDYEEFKKDYDSNNLPEVYVTEFLFDGVGMYKPYDLDDFIESGNNYETQPLKITVININATGSIEFTGELTGGMIAVNSNVLNGDVKIMLNNAKIDTDSKKVPAILVYNKDITDTNCKVTINALENTKNYIEGGKLKKVSLIPSEKLDSYLSYYSGDNKTNYSTYSNYYGVYSESEIKNILFATVTADSEDLSDGDPYMFYKAAGAISSDIDLYFEGKGYLEVTSKNKEGIETKGNLTFAGGTGDYVIYAEDDCLNTTTDSKEVTNHHNTLTIDVNSMYAITSLDADEGDAIDSNGELYINGGTILALAHPGQDAGIDSETGTYINGGTVIATGDMYDEIKSTSEENVMVLSFNDNIAIGDSIEILDENNNVLMAYKTDRTFKYLVYSSSKLVDGTYSVYKNGTITGDSLNGLYSNITSYSKNILLAYNSKGSSVTNAPGGFGGTGRPDIPNNNDTNRPSMPNGKSQFENNIVSDATATNKEFTIDSIINIFNGVAGFTEN